MEDRVYLELQAARRAAESAAHQTDLIRIKLDLIEFVVMGLVVAIPLFSLLILAASRR